MILNKIREKAKELYNENKTDNYKLICDILDYDKCVKLLSSKETINILLDLGYNEDEAISIYMELLKEI